MDRNVRALLLTQQELILMEKRNRLARELHDTVKQETFATLLQRGPSAARKHLAACAGAHDR
jgi:signal transduction histidine kinase